MPSYKKIKPMTTRSVQKTGLTKKQKDKLPAGLKKAIIKKKEKNKLIKIESFLITFNIFS